MSEPPKACPPQPFARVGALTPSEVERAAGECLGLLEAWHEADFTDDTLSLFRVFAKRPRTRSAAESATSNPST